MAIPALTVKVIACTWLSILAVGAKGTPVKVGEALVAKVANVVTNPVGTLPISTIFASTSDLV